MDDKMVAEDWGGCRWKGLGTWLGARREKEEKGRERKRSERRKVRIGVGVVEGGGSKAARVAR